jgi:putative Holliday junction resolvase
MRVLGIDYGRRRIGLALSDEAGILASPLPTYVRGRSEDRDIGALKRLIERHGVSAIVVGLPLNMNGSRGEMAREAEAFADRIQQATGLPVESFDERLTTREAERVLLEADLPRRRRKELRDSLSAVLILQGHLARRDPSDRPPNRTSEPTPSSPLG